MYGMNNSGKLFADDFTECLLEAGFIKSKYQMSIYYKYEPDGTKIVMLSYVDDLYIGILMKLLENGLWIF